MLLLPVKLQDRLAVMSPRPRPSQAGRASRLTRFSSDFLTSVKLFQRESNSLLWVPLKNSRSLMICSEERRETTSTLSSSPQEASHTLMMTKSDLVSSSECSRM